MGYTVKLLKSYQVAEGTMAFEFEKPVGYEFKPGQASDFTLIDPPETDAEGNIRTFSISCAPGDAFLRITTRMRDTAFKRVLKQLTEGSLVQIDEPYGSLLLHKDAKKPAAFLTGGIGITPFMSMIRNAAQEKSSHELYLFYSNRRPEDTAFRAELAGLATLLPNLQIIETMTEMSASKESWNGETGFIDRAMLTKYLGDISKPIYYIAGPPQMVAAMIKMLDGADIDEERIKFEEFAGY